MELVVGDIFKESGPIIVGSNTAFITSNEIISPNSVQGIFTSKYFPETQAVINQQVIAQVGSGEHSYGTTVTIRGEKTGYFCAIAKINAAGVAQSNIENIRVSLGKLWEYLSTNCDKDLINIPILGSGFARVSASREELFQEIVKSFIASTVEHTFCDGLRIVIHQKDVKKLNINIEELAQFLKYHCMYSTTKPSDNNSGTAEA